MGFGDPAPLPKSVLGFHRVLSPVAGVTCSPLCLGAMNFGDAWKDFMGECNKETAFEMLDYFHENGGNFIDTANNYQNEESEQWVGEWMEKRGVREQIVLATKFTTGFRNATVPNALQSSFTGNSTKSLRTSVDASLKKLRTSYIDLLYVHWWDFTTSIPEIMKSLNTLADQGKILYLGVSDTPAWVVSKANQYARDHGMRQFAVYQGQWSAASRDFEREIIPMAADEGMALAPWGALGGGNFKTEEQRKSNEGRNMFPATENQIAVSKVLEIMAQEKNTIMTSVALAYVLHKAPNVFPLVGGRKISHLKGNIDALSLKLSPDDVARIDKATAFDLGFPMNFLFKGMQSPSYHPADLWLKKMASHIDAPPRIQPIEPREPPK